MKELTVTLQKMLGVDADGIIGSQTLGAIAKALGTKVASYKATTIKNIQKAVGTVADGVLGSKTLTAIIKKLDGKEIVKNEVDPLIQKYIDKPIKYTQMDYKYPLVKQSVLRSGNSIYGKAGCENMLVSVPVPTNYPLKYSGKPVKSIRVHKYVADRLRAALKDIINHYGEDMEKVAPAACVYDGSYNFRKTTGTSSYSIHSWGLALDFDAANNTMKMSAPKARLSQPIYEPFWNILEYHGFNSLGRRGNYDWQHCQATHWG